MGISRMEIIGRLSSVLLAIFLVARLTFSFVPTPIMSQNRLTTIVMALCAIRFTFLVIDLARRTRTWQSMIFPSLILLVLVATLGGHQFSLLAKVAAMAAELTILTAIIYLVRKPKLNDDRPLDERLTAQLRILIPLPVARLMVTEMMIMRAAFSAILRRRRGTLEGFSYAETSTFRILPLLILLASPVDVVIIDLVLRALRVTGEVWTLALTASDIYLLIWTYGMLAAMRERPHTITDKNLRVHKGIFGHAVIALETIAQASVVSASRRARKDSEDLSVRGAAKVELTLTKPVQVVKWFVPEPTKASSVMISADNPGALCRALKADLRASTASI